jgi:hypothetical protein
LDSLSSYAETAVDGESVYDLDLNPSEGAQRPARHSRYGVSSAVTVTATKLLTGIFIEPVASHYCREARYRIRSMKNHPRGPRHAQPPAMTPQPPSLSAPSQGQLTAKTSWSRSLQMACMWPFKIVSPTGKAFVPGSSAVGECWCTKSGAGRWPTSTTARTAQLRPWSFHPTASSWRLPPPRESRYFTPGDGP